MERIKLFREANSLTQIDLAQYLGISKQFLSNIESGRCSLPKKYVSTILNNTKGWDVSMLLGPQFPAQVSANSSGRSTSLVSINHNVSGSQPDNTSSLRELTIKNAALVREIELLQAQLTKSEAEKDKLWDMVQKLINQQ